MILVDYDNKKEKMKTRLYTTQLWTLLQNRYAFHPNRDVVGARPAAIVMRRYLLNRNAFHESFNSTPEAHGTCSGGTGAIADGCGSAQRHFGPAREVFWCSIALYSTLINETFASVPTSQHELAR